MPDVTPTWPNSWDDQKPELTAENADRIITMLDDILLFVEAGEIEVGYDSIYRPEWKPDKIPGNVGFSLPLGIGLTVSIGRDRGGSWGHKGDDGEYVKGSYHTPVDIQIAVPVKQDFYPEGNLVNLWFDGEKGEHEARVLEAVVRLRTAYLRYMDWYFSLVDSQIPAMMEVAAMKLANSAAVKRALMAKMAPGSTD